MKERTFLLHVLPYDKKYKVLARFQARTAEGLSEAPKRLDLSLSELRKTVLRSGATRGLDSGSESPHGKESRIYEEFGRELFSFLLPGDVLTLYRQSLQEARRDNEGIRLGLRVDDSARELANVPWETIYDETSRLFLSTGQTPLFTRIARAEDVPIRNLARLEILGIVSGPTTFHDTPLDPINASEEIAKIEKALKPLTDAGKARLSWTSAGTLSALRQRLWQPADKVHGWTILHFIGHGGFDKAKGQGLILLERPDGSKDALPLYAETLASMLAKPHGPQLVLLNSCSGAQGGTEDIFSSTAARLALGGVPAVIAMQYPVSDPMAIAFAPSFYELLAEGLDIHSALAQTRNQLKADEYAEWITPVLYLSSRDGRLLKSIII